MSFVDVSSLYILMHQGFVKLWDTLIFNPHIKYKAIVIFLIQVSFQPRVIGVEIVVDEADLSLQKK